MLIHVGLLLYFKLISKKALKMSDFSIVHSVYIMDFNQVFYFTSILEYEIIIDDGQFGIHSK